MGIYRFRTHEGSGRRRSILWRPGVVLRVVVSLLFVLVLAPGGEAGADSIVGTWELERVDGVRPQDAPPWGFGNLVVHFDAEGRVRHWLPQQEAMAREAPYSVTDETLRAWIGLSNDVETPRRYGFPSEGWLDIHLPDGFVATFRRVEEAPTSPRCVYFTMRGRNFDEEQVSRARGAMFSLEPGLVPDDLQGRWWMFEAGEEGSAVELVLEIGEAHAELTVTAHGPFAGPPQTSRGPVGVVGDFLSSPVLACGGVSHFEVSDESLVLSVDPTTLLEFSRVRDDEP